MIWWGKVECIYKSCGGTKNAPNNGTLFESKPCFNRKGIILLYSNYTQITKYKYDYDLLLPL